MERITGYRKVCTSCGEVHTVTDYYDITECPKCNLWLKSFPYVICCEQELVLSSHTNQCASCGTLYNGFGQTLAPIEEWDSQDAFDLFSPASDDDF